MPSSRPITSNFAADVQQIVNESCILQFKPRTIGRWPFWYRALATFFGDEAHIENDAEGPVAYLTTWYADCSAESTNEHPRTVRLDHRISLWALDIQHTWRDKIQTGSQVHFAWVNPKPVDAPAVHTIGHLIVYQHPNELLAPSLLSLQFKALNLDGTTHAVVVARHGVTPSDLACQLKIDRVCRGRRCTLHRGTPGKKWFDRFTTGEGIRLVIPYPELHWGLGAVVPVFDAPVVPIHPVLSMRLEDQPQFIQNLQQLWARYGQRNAISMERFP